MSCHIKPANFLETIRKPSHERRFERQTKWPVYVSQIRASTSIASQWETYIRNGTIREKKKKVEEEDGNRRKKVDFYLHPCLPGKYIDPLQSYCQLSM